MRPHVAEISAADAATAEYPEMRPNLAESLSMKNKIQKCAVRRPRVGSGTWERPRTTGSVAHHPGLE